MKANKMLKLVASVSKHSAVKQADWVSRFFGHQPKVPAMLLEKKDK